MNGYRLLPVIISLCLAGCGEKPEGPEMAQVSGSVTLDGKPLSGAEIFFVSQGFEGYGRIKDDGSYSLVRGAPVGECKVYITKAPEGAATGTIDTSIEGMDEEQMKAMNQGAAGPRAKSPLPAEYSDPEKTKLSFNVPAGGSTAADFNL